MLVALKPLRVGYNVLLVWSDIAECIDLLFMIAFASLPDPLNGQRLPQNGLLSPRGRVTKSNLPKPCKVTSKIFTKQWWKITFP
jgi:hypothetical protein